MLLLVQKSGRYIVWEGGVNNDNTIYREDKRIRTDVRTEFIII
jgi:hypothetical protein